MHLKMFLKPDLKKNAEKRHNELWPEMRELLKKEGVSDYSIFWDKETNVLFAVQKSDGEGSSQDLGLIGDCSEMVGLYGRHHGDQPGQLTRIDPPGRTFLYAII